MNQNNEITRRSVIAGIVAAAAVPLLSGQALAGTRAGGKRAKALARSGVRALPRYYHSAVTLEDGKVLITGGYHVDPTRQSAFVAPSANVQIFDPGRNEWSSAAPMTHPRARHASVLLPDGRVAVLGGFYTGALDSVEIYDPTQNTWTKGQKLPEPTCDHSACFAQGRIIITGGPAGARALESTAVSLKSRQVP